MTTYTGDPQNDYQTFRQAVFSELASKIGPEAGEHRSHGDYANVGFTEGMAYGAPGKMGDVQFTVTLLEETFRRGKRETITYEWYSCHTDVAKVVRELLAVYGRLRT